MDAGDNSRPPNASCTAAAVAIISIASTTSKLAGTAAAAASCVSMSLPLGGSPDHSSSVPNSIPLGLFLPNSIPFIQRIFLPTVHGRKHTNKGMFVFKRLRETRPESRREPEGGIHATFYG